MILSATVGGITMSSLKIRIFAGIFIVLFARGIACGAEGMAYTSVFGESASLNVADTDTPAEYVIGAIFSVTGKAAALGDPEKKTVEMLAEQLNADGGINGVPVRVVIYDDEGDEQKTADLAKKLIYEDNALAVIGPSRSGNTLAIMDIAAQGGVPLISCAAAESIVDPVNPWVFKTPQKDSFAAELLLKNMKERQIKSIAVIYEDTAFGTEGLNRILNSASKYGIAIVYEKSFPAAATVDDLRVLLQEIKENKNVQAVVNWTILPAQKDVPGIMKELGMGLPLYHSHGYGNISWVKQTGAAADGVIFPGSRLLVADELPFGHPQKDDVTPYKEAYEAKYNEDASAFGGYAYDAFWITVFAIEQGGASRSAIRDAIENMSLTGVSGEFGFSPKDHNGLDITSLEMLTVKDGKFRILANVK